VFILQVDMALQSATRAKAIYHSGCRLSYTDGSHRRNALTKICRLSGQDKGDSTKIDKYIFRLGLNNFMWETFQNMV